MYENTEGRACGRHTNAPRNNKSCHAADRVPRRETFPFVAGGRQIQADSETRRSGASISFIAGTSITPVREADGTGMAAVYAERNAETRRPGF